MQKGLVLIDFKFKEFKSRSVRCRKKLITTILLLSFGFFFFKDLFPDLFEGVAESCLELGHVHKGSGDCHDGKSLFSYSLTAEKVLFFVLTPFKVQFDLVLTVKNNFEDPYLEPIRKPPRKQV